MNNYTRRLKATVISMLHAAQGKVIAQICRAQPEGKNLVLTLPVTVMLEISLHPDQLQDLLEAA